MDVDQRTAIEWKTLNSLLREIFKYAVCSQKPPSELRKVLHKFEMIVEILELFAMKNKLGVRFLLTGSVREGVAISPSLRDNITETDIMFSFKSLKIEAHEQSKMLIDVPSAPGHIKVAVPANSKLSKYTSVDTIFDVACALKEVTTAEGQTRYYLLAQPDANHPRAPFDVGSDIGDFPKPSGDDSSVLNAFWDFMFGPHGFHEPTAKRSGPAFARSMGLTKGGLNRLQQGKEELAINAPTILTNALGSLLSKTCQAKNKSESKDNVQDELPALFEDIIFTFNKATDRQSIGETKETKTRLLSTKEMRNENQKIGVANLVSQAVNLFIKDCHDEEKFRHGADVLFRGLFGKSFPFFNNSLHGCGNSSRDSSNPCVTSKEHNGDTNAPVSIPTNAGKNVQRKEIMDEHLEGTAVMKDETEFNNRGNDWLFPRTFEFGGSIDFVPSLECEGWPAIANAFLSRQRQWPTKYLIDQIVEDGFHIVPKCSLGGDKELEWRISFSKAEITLFESMTQMQRDCYCMFKSIYYSELQRPKVLCSYYMKTIFLWACERLPIDTWQEENQAWLLMGLLDDLMHCLVTKTCAHYFIPQNNMFQHIPDEFLLHHAKTLSNIRTHPIKYLSKMMQKIQIMKQKDKSWSPDLAENRTLQDNFVVDDHDDDDGMNNAKNDAVKICEIELD